MQIVDGKDVSRAAGLGKASEGGVGRGARPCGDLFGEPGEPGGGRDSNWSFAPSRETDRASERTSGEGERN